MELDRALRQCSDGCDTSLSLGHLDCVATGAPHGELEAGPDHQLPLKAADTHSCVGQDQAQGPEADYCRQEAGLCLWQQEGARGKGNLRQVVFFHTIQFFRSKEGHSNSPPPPRALDDCGSCMKPPHVFPS